MYAANNVKVYQQLILNVSAINSDLQQLNGKITQQYSILNSNKLMLQRLMTG